MKPPICEFLLAEGVRYLTAGPCETGVEPEPPWMGSRRVLQ